MIFESGCPELEKKIIKSSKNFGGNEENFAIFTIMLMAAFGTKNVHSTVLYNFKIKSRLWAGSCAKAKVFCS